MFIFCVNRSSTATKSLEIASIIITRLPLRTYFWVNLPATTAVPAPAEVEVADNLTSRSPNQGSLLKQTRLLKKSQGMDSSVTRFGEILNILGLFLCYWTNFHCCKWQDVEKYRVIWPHWCEVISFRNYGITFFESLSKTLAAFFVNQA